MVHGHDDDSRFSTASLFIYYSPHIALHHRGVCLLYSGKRNVVIIFFVFCHPAYYHVDSLQIKDLILKQFRVVC